MMNKNQNPLILVFYGILCCSPINLNHSSVSSPSEKRTYYYETSTTEFLYNQEIYDDLTDLIGYLKACESSNIFSRYAGRLSNKIAQNPLKATAGGIILGATIASTGGLTIPAIAAVGTGAWALAGTSLVGLSVLGEAAIVGGVAGGAVVAYKKGDKISNLANETSTKVSDIASKTAEKASKTKVGSSVSKAASNAVGLGSRALRGAKYYGNLFTGGKRNADADFGIKQFKQDLLAPKVKPDELGPINIDQAISAYATISDKFWIYRHNDTKIGEKDKKVMVKANTEQIAKLEFLKDYIGIVREMVLIHCLSNKVNPDKLSELWKLHFKNIENYLNTLSFDIMRFYDNYKDQSSIDTTIKSIVPKSGLTEDNKKVIEKNKTTIQQDMLNFFNQNKDILQQNGSESEVDSTDDSDTTPSS